MKPTKFTEANRDTILKYVREGNFLKHAAMAAGCDPRTVELWRAKGRDGNPKFAQFYRDFEHAQGLCIATHVRALRMSNDDNTRKWILAHLCPEEWGDKVKVEVQLKEKLDLVLDVVMEVCGAQDAKRVLETITQRLAG